MISIIAAIGKNNELGKQNSLLWNLPADMKHFRETTRGRTVIMGQKTFESIGRPLPNRRNIVVTRDDNFKAEGVEISNSLEKTLDSFQGTTDEVFVIGGGEIYRQSIGKADKLYITHVDENFLDADTFLPSIDKNIWQKNKSKKHPKNELNKYDLEFTEYLKK